MLLGCILFALIAISAGIFSLRLARSQWDTYQENHAFREFTKDPAKKQSIERFQKKRFRRRTIIGLALIFVGALMPVAMHFLEYNPPLGVILWTALFFTIIIIIGLGIVDVFTTYSFKLQIEQEFYIHSAMHSIQKALHEQQAEQSHSSNKQNS